MVEIAAQAALPQFSVVARFKLAMVRDKKQGNLAIPRPKSRPPRFRLQVSLPASGLCLSGVAAIAPCWLVIMWNVRSTFQSSSRSRLSPRGGG